MRTTIASVIVMYVVIPAAAVDRVAVGPAPDAQVELYWDNGTRASGMIWGSGVNFWTANEFNIATLASYNYISSSRIYYPANYPNNVWEGNGMAVFAISGGQPGSVLMPSRYVRGSGAIGGWQVYNVSWSLGAAQAFLMAYCQLYNYPNCDPVWSLDSSNAFAPQSWYYYGGSWGHPYNMGPTGYLMIRATVVNIPDVAPSSFGRVKAMFH